MKVGDRVRYVGSSPNLNGQVGTVDEVWGETSVVVKFEGLGGLLYTAHRMNLELVEGEGSR